MQHAWRLVLAGVLQGEGLHSVSQIIMSAADGVCLPYRAGAGHHTHAAAPGLRQVVSAAAAWLRPLLLVAAAARQQPAAGHAGPRH